MLKKVENMLIKKNYIIKEYVISTFFIVILYKTKIPRTIDTFGGFL